MLKALLPALLALCVGNVACSRSADQMSTPQAEQPVAWSPTDPVRWWQDEIEKLNAQRPLDATDPCAGCWATVPAQFLADRDLAKLAKEDVRDNVRILVSCGREDNELFTDAVAIVTGPVNGQRTTIGSGVLINDGTAVLTAKHVWDRVSSRNDRAVIVSNNVQDRDATRYYRITGKVLPSNESSTPDMAILQLDRKVTVPYQKHDILRDRTIVAKGRRIAVVGFGLNTATTAPSGKRRYVHVHVALSPCGPNPTPDYGCTSQSEFVASDALFSTAPCDSCDYDSGGPAYIEDPLGSNTWKIAGIVKRGVTPASAASLTPPCKPIGGCGCGGIYTFADESFNLK